MTKNELYIISQEKISPIPHELRFSSKPLVAVDNLLSTTKTSKIRDFSIIFVKSTSNVIPMILERKYREYHTMVMWKIIYNPNFHNILNSSFHLCIIQNIFLIHLTLWNLPTSSHSHLFKQNWTPLLSQNYIICNLRNKSKMKIHNTIQEWEWKWPHMTRNSISKGEVINA